VFVFLAVPIRARQPAGNIFEDLPKLNVRLETEHYALAGTISDARMAEYGRCLEYIHREYADGFANLLKQHQDGQAPAPNADSNSSRNPSKSEKRRDRQSDRKRNGKSAPSAADASRSGESNHTGDSRKDGSNPAPKEEDLEVPHPTEGAAAALQLIFPGLFPESGKFRVIVFANADEYNAFGRQYFCGATEHSRGAYIPVLKLLLVRDEIESVETYEVLFHEAFHQFLDRYIPFAPIWINEGLATYYGTARPTENGLYFDRPKEIFFDVVADTMSARELIPLKQLMLYNRGQFYDNRRVPGTEFGRRILSYSQAYTLSAYILQDDAGRIHLQNYLRNLARVSSPAAANQVTRESFPDPLLDAMAPEWLAFVNRH